MPTVATRADGIRIEISGVEQKMLAAVGTIPGVVVLAVAGKNGTGFGRLRSHGNGTKLSWTAPGASTPGAQVTAGSDGEYLLEDTDSDKWIRVQAYAAFMISGPQSQRVHLRDRYNNGVGHDDVTAAEASAGDTTDYTLTIANDSPMDALNVLFWLDASVSDLSISDDGVTYYTPTSEGHGDVIDLGTIASGSTDTLFLRRTIASSSSSDAKILNLVEFAWDGY